MSRSPRGDEFELCNALLDVVNAIGSRIQKTTFVKNDKLVEPNVQTPLRCSVPVRRRQRREMAVEDARRLLYPTIKIVNIFTT